jgi:hypothetical protein
VAAPAGAAGVTLVFLALGYSWFESYPVLRQRYYDGLGGKRSYVYWVWANLAALLMSAGLVLGPATAVLGGRLRRRGRLLHLVVQHFFWPKW